MLFRSVRREVIALQPEESRVAFGMLLALSNWDAGQLPAAVRETLPRNLKRLYQDDPSAAIHGISGWLLRKWGYHQILDEVDAVAVPWDPRSDRQWFRLSIDIPAARTASSSTAARAATTKLNLTFVAFPAGEYTIGTPPRTVRMATPFAVCDRELPASVAALCQPQITSLLSTDAAKQASADDSVTDAAASGLSWVDAVSICRSLDGERQPLEAAHHTTGEAHAATQHTTRWVGLDQPGGHTLLSARGTERERCRCSANTAPTDHCRDHGSTTSTDRKSTRLNSSH